MATDRGDYDNLTLFLPRGNVADEAMAQHKLWFVLKHVKKGLPYAEAEAWGSIWISVKNGCVYSPDVMATIAEMSKDLTV
jgi:hypothetical protein